MVWLSGDGRGDSIHFCMLRLNPRLGHNTSPSPSPFYLLVFVLYVYWISWLRPCVLANSDFGSPLIFCYSDPHLFMTMILPAPNKYLSLSLLCASGSFPFTFPSRILTIVFHLFACVFLSCSALSSQGHCSRYQSGESSNYTGWVFRCQIKFDVVHPPSEICQNALHPTDHLLFGKFYIQMQSFGLYPWWIYTLKMMIVAWLYNGVNLTWVKDNSKKNIPAKK